MRKNAKNAKALLQKLPCSFILRKGFRSVTCSGQRSEQGETKEADRPPPPLIVERIYRERSEHGVFQAYRNFCGAYNRGPALWEQACRPVIFVAWKMMRPRWWAGWRENAIQQSEEMPRVRACDEEERADRQGRPAVEMPGLPVELDDAAAAAQAGADAGGVPFLAAGAVIPKGGGLRGRRPRLRKRIAWCWRIRPRIAPPDAGATRSWRTARTWATAGA